MYSPEQLPPRMLGRVQVAETGCWLWTMSLRNGYGQAWDGEKVQYGHRYAYTYIVGPIPAGLVLDHLCKVPRCVNPEHLEPVSQAENLRRAGVHDLRPIRTECRIHGPEFMTIWSSKNRARGIQVGCRKCYNENQNRRRAAARAARQVLVT